MSPEDMHHAKSLVAFAAVNSLETDEVMLLGKALQAIEAYEEAAASVRKLVRELDVAWNGEAGAAKQASLCDMVAQIMNDLPRLHEKATNRNDELELLRKLENRVRSVRGSHPSIKEGIVLDALDALREKQARA